MFVGHSFQASKHRRFQRQKCSKTRPEINDLQTPLQIDFATLDYRGKRWLCRVSTRDQHLELQLDSLRKEGCEKIFTDTLSGASAKRPGLEDALKYLRSGDKLVIWKLDQMGRNLQHLIETVKMLQNRGIALQAVQEKIDTSSSNGRLFFHIFGALAKFEWDVIRDRTRAGLKAAQVRGRVGGRKNKLSPDQVKAARDLLKADHSVTEVARMLQVFRSTLYRYLEE